MGGLLLLSPAYRCHFTGCEGLSNPKQKRCISYEPYNAVFSVQHQDMWCAWRVSNPQSILWHGDLNPMCIPIPPQAHISFIFCFILLRIMTESGTIHPSLNLSLLWPLRIKKFHPRLWFDCDLPYAISFLLLLTRSIST